MYQATSAITQATSATTNTATIDNLPPAANAPATTSVGMAGTGIPICSTKTFANTMGSPSWLTADPRSLVVGALFDEVGLHSASEAPAAERKQGDPDDRAARRQAVAEYLFRRGMGGT